VRPGGTLLIVLHHPDSLHAGHAAGPGLADTATGQELLAIAAQPERLARTLDPGTFDIKVADVITRQATGRDGRPATATDTVLRAARRS